MSAARAELPSVVTTDGLETLSACNVCRSGAIQPIDPECNLCRCGECGYVFDSPRPGSREISAFYSQQGKYDSWLSDAAARDGLWKRRLKMILRHRAGGNLLDVGTGIGQFLHHAQPHFTEVAGTEISESAVRIARERYGLQVQQGQIEDLHLPDESFDTVTLFHVLEHVPDPARLMRRCHQLLRQDGIVVIAVPNDVLAWGSRVKKLGRNMGLRPFQKFSRIAGIAKAGTSREIHLSHFTPAVVRRLLSSNGFELAEEGLDPYYAASGAWRLAHGIYYALHRVIFRAFGINRYETTWMIGRKRQSHHETHDAKR
jgi:2-polyprenyl-3-methyl-5-hydroxy-6-metoxy-1,4-benzoquinol methylase